MKHIKVAILAILIFAGCNSQAQNTFADSIQQAVRKQIEAYPQNTLQDIYKNFFQDQLGPGHIIEDTSRAGLMLREELKQHHSTSSIYYEAIGYRNNFYRVNLSVVWNGIISYEQLFKAFVESAIPLSQTHRPLETAMARHRNHNTKYEPEHRKLRSRQKQDKHNTKPRQLYDATQQNIQPTVRPTLSADRKAYIRTTTITHYQST